MKKYRTSGFRSRALQAGGLPPEKTVAGKPCYTYSYFNTLRL